MKIKVGDRVRVKAGAINAWVIVPQDYDEPGPAWTFKGTASSEYPTFQPNPEDEDADFGPLFAGATS